MSEGHIQALEAEMARAIAAEEFERASALRDRIAALDPDAAPRIRRGAPGAMGLGTDQVGRKPPAGWVPPQKPDPGTANVKRGGSRRRT